MRRIFRADFGQVRGHAFALASALVAFALSCEYIWDAGAGQNALLRLICVASLGISTAIAARISFAKQSAVTAAFLGSGVLLGLFYWTHRHALYFDERFAQLAILCHLWVALAPSVRDRFADERIVGRTNWFLLTRLFVVGVQCGLLLIGLMFALASLNFLFGVFVDKNWYSTLATFVFFVVSSFLLVAALGERDEDANPELLRVLIRNVFAPLIVLYMAILYLYAIRIAALQEWPRGRVGWLVAGVSTLVTLTFLIKRPFQKAIAFGPWIDRLTSWSFALLAPLEFLLAGAIWRRVSEYGWTENRLALAILVAWMIGICVYYWRPQRRTIHAIPASLAAVVAVFWIGPLSLQSLALRSQTGRLRALVEFPPSPAVGTQSKAHLSGADEERFRSALEYICRHHGTSAVESALALGPEFQAAFAGSENDCWDRNFREFRVSVERAIGLLPAEAPKAAPTVDAAADAAKARRDSIHVEIPNGNSETFAVGRAFVANVDATPSDALPPYNEFGLSFGVKEGAEPVPQWRFRNGPIEEIRLLEHLARFGAANKTPASRTIAVASPKGDLKIIVYRAHLRQVSGRFQVDDLRLHAVFTPR